MTAALAELDPTLLDRSGKVVLDHVYDQDRPFAYYQAIDRLDYRLPQQAKPLFAPILEQLQAERGREALKIVDLGCSYGINAALLKWGFDLDALFAHYRARAEENGGRAALIGEERARLQRRAAKPYDFIGVDCARQALDYALEAGLIDAKIIGNFERQPPSASQRLRLAHADFILSTGCIGYVTEKTLAALIDATAPGEPWLANFVLRMFPFAPIDAMLRGRGYVSVKSRVPVRQRRFASQLEQEKVLARLDGLDIDTHGLEQDGWFYADLYLSRPRAALAHPLPAGLAERFEPALSEAEGDGATK